MNTFLQVLLTILMALFSINSFAEVDVSDGIQLWALEIPVTDIDKTTRFYTTSLGFQVETHNANSGVVELVNGAARIALRPSKSPQAGSNAARAYLNMSVGDIPSSVSAVQASGGSVAWDETEQSPVGPYIEILDPSGNPIHLIDHPWDEMTSDQVPTVFNISVRVRSVDESEPFFTSMGFSVSTREYLPETLVFKRQGMAYIVMHPKADRLLRPEEAAGGLVIIGEDDGKLTTGPSGIRVRYRHPEQRSTRDR